MRWGNWYLHDEDTVGHLRCDARIERRQLLGPNMVAAWLLDKGELYGLTCEDAVHLHCAANQLEWLAFNYQGIGDWTDEEGVQRGAKAARRANG